MKIPSSRYANPFQSTPCPRPTDPLVEIWESRRQEAQDLRVDWIRMQQALQQWKERIQLSRQAFFWKVMGQRTGFLAETWRPKG